MTDSRSPQRSGWWIFLLIALPVLYVFSAPPIMVLFFGNERLAARDTGWDALNAYFGPYIWLADDSPFSSFLSSYEDRWKKVINGL